MHPNAFIHVHGHSEHSIDDGISKVADICKRAADLGMPAIALTDHGVVSGHAELDKYAKKNGIQPLFGLEAYVVDRATERTKQSRRHMVILAMNETGLRNLTVLASLSTMYYFYKPCIDLDMLGKHNEGLIVSTACLGGWCAKEFYRETGYEGGGTPELAADNWGRLYDVFGDRAFLEIQPHPEDSQRKFNEWALQEAERNGVRLIATNDFHYVWKEDASFHPDVIRAALTRWKTSGDKQTDRIERYINRPGGAHIRTRTEMVEAFTALHGHSITQNRHFWDAMEAPTEVWLRCKHLSLGGDLKIPKFRA